MYILKYKLFHLNSLTEKENANEITPQTYPYLHIEKCKHKSRVDLNKFVAMWSNSRLLAVRQGDTFPNISTIYNKVQSQLLFQGPFEVLGSLSVEDKLHHYICVYLK